MATGTAQVDDQWETVSTPASGGEWETVPHDAPQNWKDQLGDFGTHTWNMLKGVVTSPVQLAVHPIDTAAALLHDTADEIGKGREAWSKGNYDQALEHFKYAAPVAGPILRQMREETDVGKYGAAAGDIAGFLLGGKALEAIPKVGTAAASIPSKVGEFATRPAVLKAAGAGVGGAVGHATGIPYGGLAGAYIGREAGAAVSDILNKPALPPAEVLQRLKMTPEEFRALPADGQAQVHEIAAQMTAPKATRVQVTPAEGPIDLGPQYPPGRTPAQMVEDEIAARRTPAPAPATQRVPLWQQQQAPPAAPPPEAAPAPSLPVQLPSGRVPGRPGAAAQPMVNGRPVLLDEHGVPTMYTDQGAELPETPPPQEAPIAKNPPPEAYESTYQARRARILGEHLFDKGITVEQAMRIKPESLKPEEWETLLGKDPDTGEQYHAPSDVTLKQAVVNLQHLNRMARGNLIGATVTLKNGKAGIVKAMQPDGTFEYEELP